eukprot:scaffold47566_cov57-Phaeocystis_antarctica.AAC.3
MLCLVFGAAVAVYQLGLLQALGWSRRCSRRAATSSVSPCVAFAIVVGLGLDYDVFFMESVSSSTTAAPAPSRPSSTRWSTQAAPSAPRESSWRWPSARCSSGTRPRSTRSGSSSCWACSSTASSRPSSSSRAAWPPSPTAPTCGRADPCTPTPPPRASRRPPAPTARRPSSRASIVIRAW